MDGIDREFIDKMSNTLLVFREAGDSYNFRCPYCGDSKKSSTKARGWLTPDKTTGRYFFNCFNCSKTNTFKGFLQDNKPFLLEEYNARRFKGAKNNLEDSRSVRKRLTEKPVFSAAPKPEIKESPVTRKFETTKRVYECDWALEYAASRCIPYEELEHVFCVENILEISSKIEAYRDKKFRPNRCILFPYYGSGGGLDYLQARLLEGELRYVTFEVSGGARKLWGRHRINPAKPITLFEGVMDAICVENAAASGGVDLLQAAAVLRDEHPSAEIRLCYDRDWTRNFQVYSQVKKAANLGYNLVLMDSEHKDVNDMIVKGGMSTGEVYSLINASTMTPLRSKLEIAKVKKPWKQ